MKKILLSFLILMMFSVNAIANSSYIESQKKKEEKVRTVKIRTCGGEDEPLKIAAFATNPPFSWVESMYQGNRMSYIGKGFLIDFMKNIAQELNIATRAVGYETDEEMLENFQVGNVDLIVGMYYDPKLRTAGNSFIMPSVIQNVISVVFMKGKEKPIEKFEDLIGLKGVVRRDERFYNYIRLGLPKDLQIEEAEDSREAYIKLLTGEADYFLSSPYAAEAEARRFKMNLDIAMIPVPLMGQELFVLYSGNSLCPQYYREIATKIQEKRQDMNAIKRDLISYINNWGQRFKNDPSLKSQLAPEPEPKTEVDVQ